MSTIWTGSPSPGPWYVDDTAVPVDGVGLVPTLDGYVTNPIDITYLAGDYRVSYTLAASREPLSATVVHAPSYTLAASRELVLVNAGQSTSLALPGSNTPSIEKGGTP